MKRSLTPSRQRWFSPRLSRAPTVLLAQAVAQAVAPKRRGLPREVVAAATGRAAASAVVATMTRVAFPAVKTAQAHRTVINMIQPWPWSLRRTSEQRSLLGSGVEKSARDGKRRNSRAVTVTVTAATAAAAAVEVVGTVGRHFDANSSRWCCPHRRRRDQSDWRVEATERP